MIRFVAIIFSAAALGIFVLVKIFGGSDGPAYVPAQINLAPRPVDTSRLDMKREQERRIRLEVSRRFEGAPASIIDLAANIANPDVLLNDYTDTILAMTRVEINEGYGQPFADTAPEYRHTLLREAVINGNTGAAALILDRGGDVHYNDDEMAFQAVNLETDRGRYPLWFPDYSIGSKFLRMWLDRGGKPNITHPLYGSGMGTLINHTPKNNLEGTLSLLEFGADPWSPFEVKSDDGQFLYEVPGYFMSIATGDRQHAEMAFRIAREGHYRNAPSVHAEALARTIELTAAAYADAKSRDQQQTLWTLQRSYKEIFASISVAPGPQTKRVMSAGFAGDIGGFFLAPGEIRSSATSDQEVRDRASQSGRQMWR